MIDESEEGAPEGATSLSHSKMIDDVLSVFSAANEGLKNHDPFPSFPFPGAYGMGERLTKEEREQLRDIVGVMAGEGKSWDRVIERDKTRDPAEKKK